MRLSLLLALLSGILYVFSFAPWNQSYLIWAAFLPLFVAIEILPEAKRTLKNIFLLGLIVSVLISIGGFYWIVYATQEYGGLPAWFAYLVFALFCLTNQLQVPLFLCLRERFLKSKLISAHPTLRAFVFGALYAGVEALYPKIFLDTAGNAFSHSPWIRQVADLGGPFLLTLFLVTTSELLFVAYTKKKWVPAFIAALLPIFALSYGYYRTEQYQGLKLAHANDPVFKTALVQANIGDYLKVAAERGVMNAVDQVVGKYLELSGEALKSPFAPDAIVWPETAYPAIFEHPMSSAEMRMEGEMKLFIDQFKPPYLIFGGYDANRNGEYNSIFFYQPELKKKEIYHKSVLLMFGETLPFADSFPIMKTWFPNMGFFGRGPGPQIFTVKNKQGDRFQLAPSVCYEGLLPELSAKAALLGADALLNATNDSWFGEDGEPDLHLALTSVRSIETRLPMLRATNTGYSVWIDPLGNFEKTTALGKTAILEAQIGKHFMPAPPFLQISRVFGGNWFIRMLQIFTCLVLGYVAIQSKSLKSKH